MNPFLVLNIDRDVSQKGIIRAVAAAMREKKHSAAEIATAQKTLLDPVSRGCVDFLYHIDLADCKDKFRLEIAQEIKKVDNSHGDGMQDTISLHYLDLFNS